MGGWGDDEGGGRHVLSVALVWWVRACVEVKCSCSCSCFWFGRKGLVRDFVFLEGELRKGEVL